MNVRINHTANGVYTAPGFGIKWVLRVMLATFMAHPNFKVKDFQDEVKRVQHVEISYWTAWHAWHMCMERVFGNYEESYAMSPECCNQILKRNPGSIASVATDESDEGVVPRAEEIYKMNREKTTAFERVPTSKDVRTILDHRNGQSWVVTLSKHQCDCRFWDFTGIPCEHAINASFYNRNADWK
ncbi:hypothetical protein MKW98_019607, partial [Papaver atlanticum]